MNNYKNILFYLFAIILGMFIAIGMFLSIYGKKSQQFKVLENKIIDTKDSPIVISQIPYPGVYLKDNCYLKSVKLQQTNQPTLYIQKVICDEK